MGDAIHEKGRISSQKGNKRDAIKNYRYAIHIWKDGLRTSPANSVILCNIAMAFADILEVHLSGFLVVLEEKKEHKERGGRGRGGKRKRKRGENSEREETGKRRRKGDGGRCSMFTSPLPVVRATPTSTPFCESPQLQQLQQSSEHQSEEEIETHLKTLATPLQTNEPLPSISSTRALQLWKLSHEYAIRSLEFGHHRSPFPHMTLADILLKRVTLEGVVIEKEKEKGIEGEGEDGLQKRRKRRGEMKKWLEEAESNCFVTLNLLLCAGLDDFEKKKVKEGKEESQEGGEFVSIFDSNKRNQLTAALSLLALASFQFAFLEEESLEDEAKGEHQHQHQVLRYAIKSLNAFNLALRVRFLLQFQDHQKLATSESRSISALYNWREFLMRQQVDDGEGQSLTGSGLGKVVGGKVVGGLLLLPLPKDFKVEELGGEREGERTEMVDLLNNLASSCLVAARTVGFVFIFIYLVFILIFLSILDCSFSLSFFFFYFIISSYSFP